VLKSKFAMIVFFIVVIIMVLSNSSLSQEICAITSSPSFPRQEIQDAGYDWIYYSNASYVQKNITIFPSIESVSYSSDGKFLNITFWLSSPFEENPSEGGQHYIVYVDADADNNTGFTGADYAFGVRWDNSTNTWFKEFLEFSMYGKIKVINEEKINRGFFDIERNSINLFIELDKFNSPTQYNIAFSVEDFIKGIYDTTSWLPIPPPTIDVSVFPNSLVLRPGDEKTLELRVNSTTKLQPEVFLHTNKEISTENIILDINPNRTVIPTYGLTTSELHITVPTNSQSRTHTLPIFADIHFPLERLNTKGLTLNKTSYLAISVLPSLTIPEYLNNALSTWGSPVKEMLGIITTLGSLGVGGLILNKIRKKREKNMNKKSG
jgi:hypothetical protein